MLGGFWFAAALVIFWVVSAGPGEERNQRRLLTTLLGSFLTILLTPLAGAVFSWLPPNQTPGLADLYPPYIEKNLNANSFPSQSTALYSAIATGIYSMRKLPGVLLWVAVGALVALPRMYVGGHYPSDIIGGVACGVTGYLLARSPEPWLVARLQPAFGQNARLRWFAALLTFAWILQIATGFRDVAWGRRSIALLTSSQPLCIGGDTVFGQYFKGQIDEVRIYNRALSQTEIQTDMQIPIGALPPRTKLAEAPKEQSTGLVAAYSFDEGAGTTVADASGNSNTGTIKRATWTTGGRFGNALVFDGTSALVTIPDSSSLHLTSGMTLEAWVYPTVISSDWRDVVYKEVDIYYLFGTGSDQGAPGAGGAFSPNPVYAPSPLSVNTWTHLAGTFDSTTLRLYVNGVEVASRRSSRATKNVEAR